jgi:hypothetical protein
MIFSKTIALHSIAFPALRSLPVRFRSGHAVRIVPNFERIDERRIGAIQALKKFFAKIKLEKVAV